jgi:hypothetical protein
MRSRFGTAAMWVVIAAIAVALGGATATPVVAQGRATRPKLDRPDGAVWQVIRKNCTQCHGIDDYAFYALDKAGWQNLIETKHRTGPGAGGASTLTQPDWTLLLTWLEDTLGPTTKPFPRNYVAPEITEFFTDPEANLLMSRSCVSCHALERINTARNSVDRWRVILVQMRERGARINDEELEKLVEWLGRVKGINPNQ